MVEPVITCRREAQLRAKEQSLAAARQQIETEIQEGIR